MANDYEEVMIFAMRNIKRLEGLNEKQLCNTKIDPFTALSDSLFVKTCWLRNDLAGRLLCIVTSFTESSK